MAYGKSVTRFVTLILGRAVDVVIALHVPSVRSPSLEAATALLAIIKKVKLS